MNDNTLKKSSFLKKREVVQYMVWGFLSMMLNIGLFQILIMLDMDYRVGNGITLLVVKLFSYVTNKIFVFQTPYLGIKSLLKEIGSFFVARSATFLVDFFGIMILVELFECNTFFSKSFLSILVVTLNYIFSKKFVFHKP